MRPKLGVLACLIGLGIGFVCPAICDANALAKQKASPCCDAASHSTPHMDCQNVCTLRSAPVESVSIHTPQFATFHFPVLTPTFTPLTFPPPTESCFSLRISDNVSPPEYLVFLKTIRLQC